MTGFIHECGTHTHIMWTGFNLNSLMALVLSVVFQNVLNLSNQRPCYWIHTDLRSVHHIYHSASWTMLSEICGVKYTTPTKGCRNWPQNSQHWWTLRPHWTAHWNTKTADAHLRYIAPTHTPAAHLTLMSLTVPPSSSVFQMQRLWDELIRRRMNFILCAWTSDSVANQLPSLNY